MSLKLWEASKKTKKNSELFAFENFISKRLNKKFQNDYKKIIDLLLIRSNGMEKLKKVVL